MYDYDPLDFLRALEAELAAHLNHFYHTGRVEIGPPIAEDSRVAVEALLLDLEIPWQH